MMASTAARSSANSAASRSTAWGALGFVLADPTAGPNRALRLRSRYEQTMVGRSDWVKQGSTSRAEGSHGLYGRFGDNRRHVAQWPHPHPPTGAGLSCEC